MIVKENSQRKWLQICLFVSYMHGFIHFINFKIAAKKTFQAISSFKGWDQGKAKHHGESWFHSKQSKKWGKGNCNTVPLVTYFKYTGMSEDVHELTVEKISKNWAGSSWCRSGRSCLHSLSCSTFWASLWYRAEIEEISCP